MSYFLIVRLCLAFVDNFLTVGDGELGCASCLFRVLGILFGKVSCLFLIISIRFIFAL